MLQVLRYNARLYTLAATAECGATAALAALPLPAAARAAVAAGALLGLAWTAASLAVSHYVYDRSPLYRWRWLAQVGPPPRTWVSLHAGLDDSSEALAERYGAAGGRVLDIFSAGAMPERSIARARVERARHRAEAADYRRLPLAAAATDAVFLVFTAHELREAEARAQLFAEVRRALRPGGRVIVVEHLRDWWNLAAYGPGFLHFFPARTWREALAGAGLSLRTTFRFTPFVRVFVAAAP
jgi:SAM-dependent methyltransferase